jgi:PilZ domain
MDALPEQAKDDAALRDRRRHDRVRVGWLATLRLPSGLFECLIINLSPGGAKIKLSEGVALAPGEAAALVVGKFGTFRADTVWRRADTVGLSFRDPPETVTAAFGEVLASVS